MNKELAAARAEVADLRKKAQGATEGRAQAIVERDKLRETMNTQAKQTQAQLAQAGQQVERNKAEHQRLSEQLSHAEAKIAKLSHEQNSRVAESDSRHKDFQNQLAARVRKIQELAAAVQNLVTVKTRLEKDGNVKATVAEGKAKELGAKFAVALKERKELEARHAWPTAATDKPAAPAKEKSSLLPPGDDQEDWEVLVDKLDK